MKRSLHDLINEKLPDTTGRIPPASDEDDQDNTPVNDEPCTKQQKEHIHVLLTALRGKVDAESLEWFRRARDLTKEEANMYIDSLKAIKNTEFSKEVTRRLLYIAAKRVVHAADAFTAKDIISDDFVVDEINTTIGEISSYLGRAKGILMLAIYIASSHATMWAHDLPLKPPGTEENNSS